MAEFIERKRILFFGLPWTFTQYSVKEDMITINSGLLRTTENDCYMYKVQDVELRISLAERLFGLGTVVCHTGDTTNPTLLIEHIRHAKEVKDFILEASEAARIKRRTLTTLDIGSGIIDEAEDLEKL
ncbi:MAG: PH domain-containing protein [Lachnospiraceae bacterium]|nr:PH domain-containing protein [Lachnospiraceae bacterium]